MAPYELKKGMGSVGKSRNVPARVYDRSGYQWSLPRVTLRDILGLPTFNNKYPRFVKVTITGIMTSLDLRVLKILL